MTVTENDIVNNAAAIAALVNGVGTTTITGLDAVTSLASSDLLHCSVSGVDKNITKKNALVETSSTTTVDYTITDTDGYTEIIVGDTDNNRTITLPTAADNTDRVIEVRNNNAYTYLGGSANSRTVIIDGEGAETLDYLGVQQTTITLEVINSGIRLKCNGTSWDILDVFGGEILNIGGTLEVIYTKFFSGTTAAGATTSIAHGVNFDKIIRASSHIKNTVTAIYGVYEYFKAASAGNGYNLNIDSTNIILGNVDANLQSATYRAMINYYI